MSGHSLSKYIRFFPPKSRVLVAPLNWGIGHATRCVPVIEQLLDAGYTPIIASDGAALAFLQQGFPDVASITLPSYKVSYSKNGKMLWLKLLMQLPHFIRTYRKEVNLIRSLVSEKEVKGIISDNRFGVYGKGVPSVYITHQIRVKTGIFTFLSTKVHAFFIQKHQRCWVPDSAQKPDLSGVMSHDVSLSIPIDYIGVLSRFKPENRPVKYDVLVLLSGPEPQREILENMLLKSFTNTTKRICFVRGIVSEKVKSTQSGSILFYNFLFGKDLQHVINESAVIIARSGYSTIMDLKRLHKKAFFIPTPGQSEQLYLAQYMKRQKIAPFCRQKDFNLKMLEEVATYSGF